MMIKILANAGTGSTIEGIAGRSQSIETDKRLTQ
jgi:hypothetical protein